MNDYLPEDQQDIDNIPDSTDCDISEEAWMLACHTYHTKSPTDAQIKECERLISEGWDEYERE